jgi:VCBS repeat-containing protein
MTFPFLALAAGCGVKDKIEGLLNPLVAEALILGVEEPSTPKLDPGAAGFEPGAGATVFLADAKDANELENAPVTGAEVTYSGGAGTFTMDEDDGGEYRVDSVEAHDFDYVAADQAEVTATIDGEEHTVSVRTPGPLDLTVPLQHPSGQSLTLDASSADIDNLLVVVFRADTGDVVFSNQPKDIGEFYDLAHSSGTRTVEVDGAALSGETLYGVGIAGLTNGTESEFVEVNTALSAIMAGDLRFHPLTTTE